MEERILAQEIALRLPLGKHVVLLWRAPRLVLIRVAEHLEHAAGRAPRRVCVHRAHVVPPERARVLLAAVFGRAEICPLRRRRGRGRRVRVVFVRVHSERARVATARASDARVPAARAHYIGRRTCLAALHAKHAAASARHGLGECAGVRLGRARCANDALLELGVPPLNALERRRAAGDAEAERLVGVVERAGLLVDTCELFVQAGEARANLVCKQKVEDVARAVDVLGVEDPEAEVARVAAVLLGAVECACGALEERDEPTCRAVPAREAVDAPLDIGAPRVEWVV